MIYVILSVLCNVTVAILLKVARGKDLPVQQLVLWNYPVTVLLTALLLRPRLHHVQWDVLPYHLYLPLAILLPTIFIFIALAIKYSGIVKTDIAQRMSLFIPLLAAFTLFQERVAPGKLVGVAIGLAAVICSVGWNKGTKAPSSNSVRYPVIVFIGMGIIDILFKQIAQHEQIRYTDSMFYVFVGAMLVALAILLFQRLAQGVATDSRSILWGSALGIFNFGNVYFYMTAHRAIPENPSIVFTTMNVGVIVVAALVGILVFREKLSRVNKIGLAMAVISILIIAYV